MRRSLLLPVLSVAMMAVFPSCEKIDNGDLDGNWHLTSIDTLATGGRMDVHELCLNWGIQGHLLQPYKGLEAYVFFFDHSDGLLKLSDGHRRERLEGDIPLTDEDLPLIAPFGINHLNPTFNVEKLNKKSLVLSDNEFRLSFERF